MRCERRCIQVRKEILQELSVENGKDNDKIDGIGKQKFDRQDAAVQLHTRSLGKPRMERLPKSGSAVMAQGKLYPCLPGDTERSGVADKWR